MADDPTRWTVHGSRRVYASPWVNVDLDNVEIPGGRRFDHHVLRFPRASVGAMVLDSDRVLLLWRHRFTTDTWGWEIPAGWADHGENPAEAIRREVMEETGYRVSTMRPLTTYQPMSGISSQRYQVFVGADVERISEPLPAETSRVEWMPLASIPRLMAAGQVPDGPSLTALAFYLATIR
ncbi:MAG: NUDIX hydrolase [Pseudonocardiaceae bacterium]